MSADRIDVLAVMDAAAAILVEDGAHHHIPEAQNDELRNLREARAAVADLIAAIKEHDAATLAHHNGASYDALTNAARLDAAYARRTAALARVSGAP